MKLALVLVSLIGPHGQAILVNPEAVTSLRQPREANVHYLAPGTKCVLVTTGGNTISVSEPCDVAAAKLGGKK